MLHRDLTHPNQLPPLQWQDLERGFPTLIALAQLASAALASLQPPKVSVEELSDEAKTLLAAAGRIGAISIRGDRNAFEPAQRLLFLSVELEEGRRTEFRGNDPEQTMRFLEGFRQLCQFGLVVHQVLNEFSLTARGFEIARSINLEQYSALYEYSRESY